MSKLDQLRRQREAQHERQEQQARSPGPALPARIAPPITPAAEPRGSEPKASQADAKGACEVCGKVRVLANGLVSNHQKGFGKMCPGSRKEPA
jgi:hypothetical protein